MPLERSQLGHYQLLHHLGNDETGAVYLAQDVHAPRQVAVKMLRIDDTLQENSSGIVRRIEELFEREMQTIACLDHPHILSILDFGMDESENTPYAYVAMPYRPAGSLASWLTQPSNVSRLPLSIIAGMLVQLGEALHHAHEHGVMHQDIKPTNILLNADTPGVAGLPDLLLSDFSIARLFATHSSQGLSQSAYVRSAYLFLAPEQWDGKSVPASDQYALAILAFYLLTGKYPFHGSLSQVIRQHHQAPPPALGSLDTQLDPAIDKIIQRALAKEPEKRFPSILDFAQAFAPFQGLADVLPFSQAPANGAALSGQSPTFLPEQPVQRPQMPSALAASGALPLAQELSQGALLTQNQKESVAISPSLLPHSPTDDATRIASKPAQPSSDKAPGASQPALPAQVSSNKTSIATRIASPSPDEALIASKSGAVSTRLPTQASPDDMPISTWPTQIASGPAAMPSDKPTPQASLPNTGWSSAITQANNGIRVNNDNPQFPITPPTVLAANMPPPVINNRSAPPLPIFQFHEPQMQFQPLIIRRKSFTTLQKSLVIALIVLLVLAASGAFLFKSLIGRNLSTASSKSNGTSSQANETIQVGQSLSGAGGTNMITVTPTSTNRQTPTITTPGSRNGSTPGSQNGSTPGATSTQTPGKSTTPTAQPTSPAAQPTAKPTALPTAKSAPTATPTPHGCTIDFWSSTLSPTNASGGSERVVSPYCSGVVSITLTSAPASGGHEVEMEICYGLHTSNCSGWVAYTGVNVWHVVATGLSNGQGFYINSSCSACSGSPFKIYGSIEY